MSGSFKVLLIKCLTYFCITLFIALISGAAFHEVAAVVALFNTLILDVNVQVLKIMAEAQIVTVIKEQLPTEED